MVIAIINANVPLVGYPKLRSQIVTFLSFVVFFLRHVCKMGRYVFGWDYKKRSSNLSL